MRLNLLTRLGLESHDPDGDSRRGRLPDTGPSAMRYLTVTTLAVGAVVAAAGIMPGIGHGVRTGLCGTGDTACSRYAIPEASFGDCQVLSHADTVTDDAVVFTDDLGRSGRLTLSRTVDRNAVVHWFVRQDDDSGGAAGAGANGAGGELTEFASEDAAREYITQKQHQPVRLRLARADPTGLLSALATRIDGHRPVSQGPSAYFVDGGDGLDLAGEARSGVGGDPVAGGENGIAEVKTGTGPRSGATVYVQLSATAGAALGLLPAETGQLPATAGLAVASVVYDWTNQPQRLTIEAAGRLPGSLGPPFGQTSTDVMAGLLSPGPSAGSDGGRFTGRVSISVPLNGDPQTAVTAADALHAVGVPLLLDLGTSPDGGTPVARSAGAAGSAASTGSAASGTSTGTAGSTGTASSTGTAGSTQPAAAKTSPVLRFYRLLDHGTSGGSVTVNTYLDPAVGRPGARPKVSLGLQGGLTIAGLLPAADFYYAPQQGFVEWQRCG